VTVQNTQFSIHVRFANNANGYIRRICTRRLICSYQFASGVVFLTKSNNANHHESRIVWRHHYDLHATGRSRRNL